MMGEQSKRTTKMGTTIDAMVLGEGADESELAAATLPVLVEMIAEVTEASSSTAASILVVHCDFQLQESV
jgi:hypothetical protein